MLRNENNCGATVDELLTLALSKEDKLWDDLEELGLLPIEMDQLPEAAVYIGHSTWLGESGKSYLINPMYWIEWECIEGFSYSEKVNSKQLYDRYNDPTIRITKKELL